MGTRNGQLLEYSVNRNEIDNKMELQLLKYCKNFSKKPIVQIEVVAEESLLFSLSDSIINVSDLTRPSVSLIHSAANTKGANIFCLDVQVRQSFDDNINYFIDFYIFENYALYFNSVRDQNQLLVKLQSL